MASSSRRYLFAVITVCVGVLLACSAYVIVRNWERDRIQSEFDRLASGYASSIQVSIDRNLMVVDSIAGLYAASREVERHEFREFVKGPLSYHGDIQALEWIPRVRNSERPAYEEAARRDGLTDFQITEREAQGQMVRASRRNEYFPVFYVEPLEGNKAALGFDLASNPTLLKGLERARNSDSMVVTERIKLVQETTNQFGFLTFQPVYRKGAPHGNLEERRENLIGFALGVFRVGDMVEGSLRDLTKSGIDIHIYDETASESKRFLYFHPSRTWGVAAQPTDDKGLKVRSSLHWRTTLRIPGRQWSLLFHPTPVFFATHRTWEAQGFLASGLLLTTLLGVYLFSSVSHITKVERFVVELESEITERKRAEEGLKGKTQQLEAVSNALTAFLKSGNWGEASALILNSALKQTDSGYGFVGVVVDGILRILAHAGIVWDEVAGREFYEEALRTYHDVGYLEFPSFENLFGKAITSGQTVMSNDPSSDPSSGGLPPGHPPLNSFLGVPILWEDEAVGIIGVANRAGGYTGFEQDKIEILSKAAGVLFDSYRRQEREAALEEERKRAEEALEQMKRYLESLLGTSTDAIIATDRDRKLVFFNPGAEAMSGYRCEEVIGRRGPVLYENEEDAKEVMRLMREGDGTVSGFETTFRTKDGSLIPVLISSSILYDEDGQVVGTVGFSKDLRERKRMEQEFLRSEKMASLGLLSWGATHEILNPLNIIMLILHRQMEDEALGEEYRDDCRELINQAKRINEIVSGLAIFAKQMKAERQPVAIQEKLGQTLQLIEEEARQRGIEVVEDYLRASPVVMGNPPLLQQAFEHILGNAVEAMPEGGTLTLQVREAVQEDAQQVNICISDTGIGIPPEQLSKVFDPFFTTRDMGKGKGLGLSIAHGIVEGHGGTVFVESEEGRGTTFIIQLPLEPTAGMKPS